MPEGAPDIWFYQLLHEPLERALPKLLEKTRERGWKAVVQMADVQRMPALDQALWTFSAESFLAHGVEGEADAGLQPIYIASSAENPNAADIRFFVAGAGVDPAALDAASGYKRLALIFDGRDDDALAAARAQWRELKPSGCAMSYYEQRENGGWEKKS